MVSNTVIGFIIPWLFGGYLYKKDKKMLFIIVPFAAVLAFLANLFGFYFEFWEVEPELKESMFSVLPMCIGIYPVLGSYMIHFIQKEKYSPWFLIFLFTTVTTLLEFLYLIWGKVTYHNGWNIYWTFLSYLIPYILGYGYYLSLNKLNAFD